MGIKYEYSAVSMQDVASDIDEFIIPENQKACLLLWSKNIFTIMCNNYENDESWITISELDEHNQSVFDEISKKDPRLGSTWGGRGFRIPIVPGKGKDTFKGFKPLIELFSMQDVQREGYLTIEEFMAYYTECYKEIPNPDYVEVEMPDPDKYEDTIQYIKALDRFNELAFRPQTIKIFDDSKMIKSFEEYVNESELKGLYDSDNGRVYKNKFYYDAHMKYKSLQATPKLN